MINFSYEIHISVKDNYKFNSICKKLNVKPIRLELYNSSAEIVDKHCMTSSVFKGSSEDLKNKINEIKNTLIDNNIEILRTKVETVPWFKDKPEFCYYEHHIDLYETDFEEICEKIQDLNDFMNEHMMAISSSVKKNNVSLTIRSYHIDYKKFLLIINKIKNFLKRYMRVEEDNTIEYAIYDDNIELDKLWI